MLKFSSIVWVVAGTVMAIPTVASSQQPADTQPAIKAMTFNIRYDRHRMAESSDSDAWKHAEGNHRRDRVQKVIEQQAPDLLGLQEAMWHQVEDIAAELPGYSYYAVGRDDGQQRGETCAVFYRDERFEKLDQGTFWLSETPQKPGSMYPGAACARVATWVRLRDQPSGHELLLVNTHWDHVSQPAREHAAGMIASRLKELSEGAAVVLMGDLNAREDTAEIQWLVEAEEIELVDTYRHVHPEQEAKEATFNGFENRTEGERIDYIFHTQELEAESAEIVRTTFDGLNASDHFPVVADLKWAE